MNESRSNRRGYALMLVLVFVILFGAVLGVAWRRVASALRVERFSDVRRQCDAGSIRVLAQAMQVLETRLRQPGSGAARIDGWDNSPPPYYQILNTTAYRIDFTREGNNDGTQWSVSVSIVAPGDVDYSNMFPPS